MFTVNYNAVNTCKAFCYLESTSVTTKPENPMVVRVVFLPPLLYYEPLLKSTKKVAYLLIRQNVKLLL